MSMRGTGRLKRVAERLRKIGQPRSVILLYHRVAELDADPQLLCVAPGRFKEHMELLARSYNPISLLELSRFITEQCPIPDRSVAVTLDDGYADNLYKAKPLLEGSGVPGTFFVTTGLIGSNAEFWWDALERVLLRPNIGPEELDISVEGVHLQYNLGDAVRYGLDDFRQYRLWNVEAPDLPTRRHRLYKKLCNALRPIPAATRDEVIRRLAVLWDAEQTARVSHRALEPHELVELGKGELSTIGAHTVTHPVLSTLPSESEREEIELGKRRLEEILAREVTVFSYPYGGDSDYTYRTADMVARLGFACACANVPETVWKGSDPFRLPRFIVRDWSLEEFASKLDAWFAY